MFRLVPNAVIALASASRRNARMLLTRPCRVGSCSSSPLDEGAVGTGPGAHGRRVGSRLYILFCCAVFRRRLAPLSKGPAYNTGMPGPLASCVAVTRTAAHHEQGPKTVSAPTVLS